MLWALAFAGVGSQLLKTQLKFLMRWTRSNDNHLSLDEFSQELTNQALNQVSQWLQILQIVRLAQPWTRCIIYLCTECLGGQNINCGSFCCPPLQTNELFDTRGNRRDQCCSTFSARIGCCSRFENSQQFGTSVCGGRICPDFNGSPDEIFDSNNRPRNECCRYFRGGCCTAEENSTLEIL